MTDMEFVDAEMSFRNAIEKYIEACQRYGIENIKDRIDDCVYDATKEAGIED